MKKYIPLESIQELIENVQESIYRSFNLDLEELAVEPGVASEDYRALEDKLRTAERNLRVKQKELDDLVAELCDNDRKWEELNKMLGGVQPGRELAAVKKRLDDYAALMLTLSS